MDILKKVTKQTAWQLFGKAVTSLSTLVILGLVSRHYGASGTGVFTLALTYLAFFYLAADFGLNAYLLPQLLEQDPEMVWRKLLGMRLLLSLGLVLAALLFLPFLPFHSSVFTTAVLFGSLAIIGNGIFTSGNSLFQSKLRYDLSVIASSIDALPTLLFIFLLIIFHFPIQSLLIVHMLGWLVTGGITLFFVKKFLPKVSPLFDLDFIKRTVQGAWPISLTLILNVVYFRVDSFILTATKSFTDVGVYNLAYQVFQSALVLPTFIMNGFYPLMLEQLSANFSYFLAIFKKALLAMLSISLLGTLLTIVLSPLVISLIAGHQNFSGSVTSLRVLSFSFPAYFLSSLLMWALVSLKRYKSVLVIYLLGLLVNGVLNYLYIPHYSYIASSFITGISEYLILILQAVILFPALKRISK